jgi:flagellin
MALAINTNIMSMFSQRALASTQGEMATSLQRLSSGLRVNSARDDAAGMFSIERMTADIRGLQQASRNAADGISLAQTAEGALGQISGNLQRIRELAVQSANGTVEDRTGLQAEVDELTSEIERLVDTVSFNGVVLLDGTSGTIDFQIGQDGGDVISASGTDMTGLNAYGGAGTVDVDDQVGANAALALIDADIDSVSSSRATFGAVQNRFESVIANVASYTENLSAARSRIQDADFAAETANLTRTQILQQAGVAMLAQANAAPQLALSLLQ